MSPGDRWKLAVAQTPNEQKKKKSEKINKHLDRGSISGRVIAKTQKMVFDAGLLSSQHYKVRIKGKVKQSRVWSSALPYTSVR